MGIEHLHGSSSAEDVSLDISPMTLLGRNVSVKFLTVGLYPGYKCRNFFVKVPEIKTYVHLTCRFRDLKLFTALDFVVFFCDCLNGGRE